MRSFGAFFFSALPATIAWLAVSATGILNGRGMRSGYYFLPSDLVHLVPFSLPVLYAMVCVFSLLHILIPLALVVESQASGLRIPLTASAGISGGLNVFLRSNEIVAFPLHLLATTLIAMAINTCQAALFFWLRGNVVDPDKSR